MIPGLERFDEYAEQVSAQEPEVLRRLREEAYRSQKLPQQISGPVQGRLLAFLTRLIQPKQALEIGTFVGYSALCFAEALPEGGRLITLDRDPTIRPIAQRYFDSVPYGRKITLMVGDALTQIRSLKGLFDLVYIDADKENYSRYYDAVLGKVSRGGLIVADNLFWSGAVLNGKDADAETKALRAFARKVRADARVEPILLTVRDGLLLARKR